MPLRLKAGSSILPVSIMVRPEQSYMRGFADGTSRSLRDIAHLLGLSHPVVERLERRARLRLRHELEQAGYSAA
jgi:hypothetical protein